MGRAIGGSGVGSDEEAEVRLADARITTGTPDVAAEMARLGCEDAVAERAAGCFVPVSPFVSGPTPPPSVRGERVGARAIAMRGGMPWSSSGKTDAGDVERVFAEPLGMPVDAGRDVPAAGRGCRLSGSARTVVGDMAGRTGSDGVDAAERFIRREKL